MEHVRQAIERAKELQAADAQPQTTLASLHPEFRPNSGATGMARLARMEFTLNSAHLESQRIIAHDSADVRSRSFDILRTQVLQSMDMASWQILGVTSPTPGCGKTVISANLALSIARHRERSVLLVDLDLQKPKIASHLGLTCDQGILTVLEGRTKLKNAIVEANIGNLKFSVLPCEASTASSSEWMASRSMSAILQEIKRDFKAWTVIFDLPPLLVGDDVISILPQIDCVLFVAAVGISKVSEIRECNKFLEPRRIVRTVLNKASDMPATYYA